MKKLPFINMQYFWKGCVGWIVILFILDAIGLLDSIEPFLDDKYKGGLQFFLIGLPLTFLLGSLIHNFKTIIKKIYK
jgi:hypothetical protein|tara:strand:- start:275 stop:505 length:231 start_codon:yes stop_codon:yes gene_type:complete